MKGFHFRSQQLSLFLLLLCLPVNNDACLRAVCVYVWVGVEGFGLHQVCLSDIPRVWEKGDP